MATSKTTNTYNRQNWEDAVSKQPIIMKLKHSEYDITMQPFKVHPILLYSLWNSFTLPLWGIIWGLCRNKIVVVHYLPWKNTWYI